MPTGYTAILFDEPGTPFDAFVLRCARGMGALIHMRDDSLDASIPDEVKPYDYHRDALEKAYTRARELETMTDEEADRHAAAEYAARLASKAEGEKKYAEELKVVEDMIAKVEAWKPPTPDHDGLKKFMLEQLTTSKPYKYEYPKARLDGRTWLIQARTDAARNIEYHAKHWREDQARAERATDWIRKLKASLRDGVPCPPHAEDLKR